MKTCFQMIAFAFMATGALGLHLSPVQAGTIAYWKFENSGSLTTDSSGNGHGLTNSGVTAASSGPNNPSAGYAYFNGSGTITTATALNLNSYNQLTVEFFVKFDGAPGSVVMLYEAGANYGATNGGIASYLDSGFLYGAYQSTGSFIPTSYHSDRVAGTVVTSGTGLQDSGWHHVAVLYDRNTAVVADKMKLYVDYTQVGTEFHNGALSQAFANATFFLGSRNQSDFLLKGWMDEFRISDALLAPNQFVQFTPIPEPASLALLLMGMVGLNCFRKRRP